MSIWDALEEYHRFLKNSQPPKKAEDIFNLTMTACTRYALTGWGYPPPKGRKPTKAEKEAAQSALQNLPVSKLKELEDAIEEGGKILDANGQQMSTYRSKGENFVKWAKQQAWFPSDVSTQKSTRQSRSPRKRHGHGSTSNKKLTARTHMESYAVGTQTTPLPEQIAKATNWLNQYLTAELYPGRHREPVKPGVAETYIRALHRILGWIHYYAKPVHDSTGKIIGYEMEELNDIR
jgi:hypothetical protein